MPLNHRYGDNEVSRCENCEYPTKRHCGRCGQRICRACATDHPVRKYGDPPELWKPCKRKAK